ncbi:hypothetical protein KXD40_003953 [Peronospora effusa]|nr:hypothetical protein KXD40_003953 [Peronospora effusa]
MAGEASCAFDEDSGQHTPVGFRDTPGQWYTANHRKRAALSQLDGKPTQRDSQMTQAATEGVRPSGESTAPLSVASMPCQKEKDGIVHEEDDVDEEETQIRMTNSEEQEGALRLERKIVEETVPLPIPSAVSSASRSVGGAGMENGDDDSNMSDDMLEEDGPVVGLSEIAALFRHREEEQEVVQNRIYKPRTFFRAAPDLPTRNNSDSSGGETEIEGEPAEDLPVKSKVDTSDSPVFQGKLPRLAKSASCLKTTVQEDTSDPERKSRRRSLSTPEKTPNSTLLCRTPKRDQHEAPDGRHVKSKRTRLDEDFMENQKAAEKNDEDNQDKHSTSSQLADEITLDILTDKRSLSDEVKEASSRSAVTVPPKAPTSRKCATVTDSTESQSEGGSIRVILTGLEPTAAIHKKIKSITDAVYESNIEKATHVVAPQNQLKRTVKLLCGISCCTHILGERWLDESARAGAAVDEQANYLHDEEAESKWQFGLRSTMYDVSLKQRQRLFAGYSVFITNHKSVLPPVKDLVKIVECAGGKASSKGKPGIHDVVISSEMALTAASVRKQLVNANPERIYYSPELILSSVLQQRVELDKHRLKLPATSKSWTTKQLQVFLEDDDNYVNFLDSIEQKLAKKLRFECRLRGGSLVGSVAFNRFVESAAQLRHLHLLFQEKMKPIVEPLSRGDDRSVNVKCKNLTNIMADMLRALRFLYGQLICKGEATQATLETVLGKENKEWDGKILVKYLEAQHLTAEKLMSRPLKRFYELVDFVKALSNILSGNERDETGSNDSDTGSDDTFSYAPQLMQIVQENQHYIHLVKADAQEEKELIALQTCFYGDGADVFNDLSNNKLLLFGEVFLIKLRDRSDSSGVGCEAAASTGLLSRSEKVYAHCFQDGTLVCSKGQSNELGISFVILHRIQLKQDAAFVEFVPASTLVLEASEKARGLALISQETTLVFAWKDIMESQRWADTIGGFLEMNGSRTEVLHQSRTIDKLPIREEISAELVDKETLSTKFASFYDDHLPGVFWMAPPKCSSLARWELVEIVFYARWLLVLRMEGWKRHSALYDFDTHSLEMKISEQLRADKEWSLVISNGSVDSVTLVSMKRTRIDFWFDQVCKAVESAKVVARQVVKEKKERLAKEDEEVRTQRDSMDKVARNKRKIMEASDNSEASIALANEKERSMPNSIPAGSCDSKPGDDTDEECDGPDRDSMTINVKDNQSAAPPAKKMRRSSDKSKQALALACTEENDILAAITLVAVKTPKTKWLTRKSNETTVVPTQASLSIPTDESTSDIDTTQLPANEENAENEPKPKEVRIILTGIELTASIRKKINLIAGAVYEDNIEQATHILAPKGQLKRTVKLLCGISRCAHILDVRWLEESARVGAPIYERAHCLKDAKAETKWQFDLRKTMYDFTPEQRQQLFAGHQVYITNHKSMLPPVNDLVKIVECAGGTAITKGSAGPDNVVITSEAALATASVRKVLTQANPQRIYSTELILSSILQQYLDFGKNRLEQTSAGSRRRK